MLYLLEVLLNPLMLFSGLGLILFDLFVICLGLCFALIHFVGPFLAVVVERFLFGHLFLVVGNPNALICFPLFGEAME
jgi:hypothetical protein